MERRRKRWKGAESHRRPTVPALGPWIPFWTDNRNSQKAQVREEICVGLWCVLRLSWRRRLLVVFWDALYIGIAPVVVILDHFLLHFYLRYLDYLLVVNEARITTRFGGLLVPEPGNQITLFTGACITNTPQPLPIAAAVIIETSSQKILLSPFPIHNPTLKYQSRWSRDQGCFLFIRAFDILFCFIFVVLSLRTFLKSSSISPLFPSASKTRLSQWSRTPSFMTFSG